MATIEVAGVGNVEVAGVRHLVAAAAAEAEESIDPVASGTVA